MEMESYDCEMSKPTQNDSVVKVQYIAPYLYYVLPSRFPSSATAACLNSLNADHKNLVITISIVYVINLILLACSVMRYLGHLSCSYTSAD